MCPSQEQEWVLCLALTHQFFLNCLCSADILSRSLNGYLLYHTMISTQCIAEGIASQWEKIRLAASNVCSFRYLSELFIPCKDSRSVNISLRIGSIISIQCRAEVIGSLRNKTRFAAFSSIWSFWFLPELSMSRKYSCSLDKSLHQVLAISLEILAEAVVLQIRYRFWCFWSLVSGFIDSLRATHASQKLPLSRPFPSPSPGGLSWDSSGSCFVTDVNPILRPLVSGFIDVLQSNSCHADTLAL